MRGFVHAVFSNPAHVHRFPTRLPCNTADRNRRFGSGNWGLEPCRSRRYLLIWRAEVRHSRAEPVGPYAMRGHGVGGLLVFAWSRCVPSQCVEPILWVL